tara:strand:- start:7958 stop:8299 length:342 start_codon:yes stop_codon:yes gene_type:complete
VTDIEVKKPQQDRSQATLDRILAGTIKLLDQKPFDQISITEIVQAAPCSVGAFYKRFASKDDVLPYLLANLQQQQNAIFKEMLNDPDRMNLDLYGRRNFLSPRRLTPTAVNLV